MEPVASMHLNSKGYACSLTLNFIERYISSGLLSQIV